METTKNNSSENKIFVFKSSFRDWELDDLETVFGFKQVETHPLLEEWLQSPITLSDDEKKAIEHLQTKFMINMDNWNAIEIQNKLVSPLMLLVDFDQKNMGYFLRRDLKGKIGNHELNGKVDILVATGQRSPHVPLFCLNTCRKDRFPASRTTAETLVAMMIGQEKNNRESPMYGAYIFGRNWFFILLKDQEFAISNAYTVSKDDIFTIFKVLKSLKSYFSPLA